MILERFQIPGLEQYSFVVGDSGSIAVVDPKRDENTYIEYAQGKGLQIAYVIDTHFQPESMHVATALAAKTGAQLCLSGHAGSKAYQFSIAYRAIFEGDELPLG